MTNKHNEQECCKKQLEIAGLIRDLCANLENEENEQRERHQFGEVKSQQSAPNNECLLQCTPCRQLPQECNTAEYGKTTRKQRRNAIPNLCTTRGQVSTNHLYVNRWVRPDPSRAPLITYPEYANQRDKSEDSNKNQQTLDGVISDQCHCFKRNGLQDDCPVPKCMLNPGCKALPEPRCPNMYEERLREAKRACEEGRYGSPSSMYCPDY